jgi:hypothetical protein
MNDFFLSRDVSGLFGHWAMDVEKRLEIGSEDASRSDRLGRMMEYRDGDSGPTPAGDSAGGPE